MSTNASMFFEIEHEAIKDKERQQFLRSLDSADFEVTDWEAKFIESNLARERFSPKQREIIDQMHQNYARKLRS